MYLSGFFGLDHPPLPPSLEPDPKLVAWVRQDLSGERLSQDCLSAHIDYGVRGFPVYLHIFRDPKTEPLHFSRICLIVSKVKADRQCFLEPCIQRLSDDRPSIRRGALLLLSSIGSERDTVVVVALLYDDDISIRYSAAETLSIIGGPRALTALDIWLKQHAKDKQLVQLWELVKEKREDLAEWTSGFSPAID